MQFCVQPEEQGCFRTHKIQSRDGNPPLHMLSLVVTEDTLQQKEKGPGDVESEKRGQRRLERAEGLTRGWGESSKAGGGGARGFGADFWPACSCGQSHPLVPRAKHTETEETLHGILR